MYFRVGDEWVEHSSIRYKQTALTVVLISRIDGGGRTLTPFGNRFWVCRVCQFHHTDKNLDGNVLLAVVGVEPTHRSDLLRTFIP